MIDSQTRNALDSLARVMAGQPFVVLSGAGISTPSGIPDYRDNDGVRRGRQPMMYQEFLARAEAGPRHARLATGAPGPAERRPLRPGHPSGARADRRADHPERRQPAPPGRQPPGHRTARQPAPGALPGLRAKQRAPADPGTDGAAEPLPGRGRCHPGPGWRHPARPGLRVALPGAAMPPLRRRTAKTGCGVLWRKRRPEHRRPGHAGGATERGAAGGGVVADGLLGVSPVPEHRRAAQAADRHQLRQDPCRRAVADEDRQPLRGVAAAAGGAPGVRAR
ncbi:silent information regulator protein Sir2 [Pseudomonas sp. CF161]|nr:silent information regulator protein Sir2 [Pseudomonas sp. CF161]